MIGNLRVLVVVDARKLELKVALGPLALLLEEHDATHARELVCRFHSVERLLAGELPQHDRVGGLDFPSVHHIGHLFKLLDGALYAVVQHTLKQGPVRVGLQASLFERFADDLLRRGERGDRDRFRELAVVDAHLEVHLFDVGFLQTLHGLVDALLLELLLLHRVNRLNSRRGRRELGQEVVVRPQR